MFFYAMYPPLQLDYSPTNPHPQLRRTDMPSPIARVPRPRNAFMIFRSAFWAEQKIHRTVEHDHRHISRIVGHCWNNMPDEEKDFWRRKADQEKVEHEMKHPGYRFCPTARTKKPVKRRVKRNGVDDLLRCKQVAELVLSGKQGKDLVDAVRFLRPPSEDEERKPCIASPGSHRTCSEEPPFRSPLLPPADLVSSAESPPVVDEPPFPQPESCHVMATTDPSCSLIFQTGSIPPLAYSLYNAQASASYFRHSFDFLLEPISMAQFPITTQPLAAFCDPYALCEPGSAPPLPAPEPNASIRTEPVLWNVPFPFEI